MQLENLMGIILRTTGWNRYCNWSQ